MKNKIRFLIFFIFLLGSKLIFATNITLLNKIVAIVNDKIILLHEFNKMKSSFQEIFNTKILDQDKIENQILSNLILHQYFVEILNNKNNINNLYLKKHLQNRENHHILHIFLNKNVIKNNFIYKNYKEILEHNLQNFYFNQENASAIISKIEINNKINHVFDIEKYLDINYILIPIFNKKNIINFYKKKNLYQKF